MAVRRESVVLDLQTNFPIESARAAASLEVLKRQLKSIDGDFAGLGRTSDDAVRGLRSTGDTARKTATDLRGAGSGADDLGRKLRTGGAEIDRYSGRLRLLTDLAVMLGPALVPIGAVAVPAITGLAAQVGVAALAAGALVGSFQGVGEALEAVNEAAIDPTAANLDKAREAMRQLSPAAREMVRELRDFIPELRLLRDIGAEEMFPGITRGLDGLESALPRVQRLMQVVSEAVGDIAGDAGESLGGDRWAPFLDFLAVEAPGALRDLATAVGNTAHALAGMWMAFTPLNNDFSDWLVDATARLDDWATNLPTNESFAGFMDYIRETGPQVAATFGAIVHATSALVAAAAPIGGPVLGALEGLFDAVAAIAGSDLGTPILGAVAAMAALNRVVQVGQRLNNLTFGGPAVAAIKTQGSALRDLRTDYAALAQVRRVTRGGGLATDAELAAGARASERMRGSLRSMGAEAGKAGALVAGLGLATSGAADDIGLTNTASLALMGTMAGPWGTAIGGSAGAALDLNAALGQLGERIDAAHAAMRSGEPANMAREYERLKADMDAIAGSADSVGDLFSPTEGMNRVRGIWGKMTGDSDEAARTMRQLEDSMAAADRSAGRVEGYDRQAEAVRQSRTAAAEAGRSFLDLGKYVTQAADEAGLSMSQFIHGYERDLRAQANMTRNLAIAAARGLDPTILNDLQDRGVEGARLLETIVNGTEGQFDRLNRAAAGAGEGVTRFSKATEQGTVKTLADVEALARQFGNLSNREIRLLIRQTGAEPTQERVEQVIFAAGRVPKRILTQVREQGAEKAQVTIAELIAKYNLTPKQIRTLIRESGAKPTQATIQELTGWARELARQNPNIRVRATDAASGTLARIRAAIFAIPLFRSTTVTTTYRGVRVGSAATSTDRAAGGQVWASGNQSRGPRDDSIDARLSHREYVHQVAAVDYYGERFMADVNARRFPKPPGYANGGSVNVADTWRFAAGGQASRAKKKPQTPTWVLTDREQRGANRGFDIGRLDVADTRRELREFARDIREAGGRVGKDFDRLSVRIVGNARKFEKLDARLESVKDTRSSAVEAGRGAFAGDIFKGTAADLRLQLEADRNDANAAAAAVQKARSGLGAEFSAGLAGSGNLGLAQELARMSRTELASLQSLYAGRAAAQSSLGAQAGAGYDQTIASLTRQQAQLTATLNRLEGAVERGARNGTAGKARAATTKAKAKGK